MSEPKDFPQDMRIELFDSTQILIPFTREEWLYISEAVRFDLDSLWDDADNLSALAMNILDRIEKNLGVE